MGRRTPARRSRGVLELDARAVAAFRLARHRLIDPRGDEPAGRVASAIGGAQAQLLPAAFASLAARTRSARAEALLRGLWKDRSFAVLWTLRGTLHLVPAREVARYGRGTTGRWEREVVWFRGKGLAPVRLAEVLDLGLEVLEEPRTLGEFAEALGAALGARPTPRRGGGWGSAVRVPWLRIGPVEVPAGYLLRVVGARGVVCRATPSGTEPRFVAARRWVPGWRDLDRDRAVDELLETYLGAFGPATPRDFAAWTGLRASEVRAAWSRGAPRLAEVRVGATAAFARSTDLDALAAARLDRPSVRLLPYFDGFLLGHRDRAHLVAPEHHRSVYRPQGWIAPVVLVDGEIAGTWSGRSEAGRLRIDITPTRRPTDAVRRGIAAEAERLAGEAGTGRAVVTVRRVAGGAGAG